LFIVLKSEVIDVLTKYKIFFLILGYI
jgi:hypothetical protein